MDQKPGEVLVYEILKDLEEFFFEVSLNGYSPCMLCIPSKSTVHAGRLTSPMDPKKAMQIIWKNQRFILSIYTP